MMLENKQSFPSKAEIATGYDQIVHKCGLSPAFYRACTSVHTNYQGRILDAGCGNGLLLKRLRTLAKPGTKFFGLDISPKLCEVSRQNNPVAEITCGDIEQMPFADNFFDIVFMTEALEHLLDYNQALGEVRRVLKPNGIFIVTVPNRDWLRYDFYDQIRDKKLQPVDDHYFRFEEIKSYLKLNHFKILKIRGLDNLFYYGLIHELEKIVAFFLPFLHHRMKRLLFKCVNQK